MSAETSTPGASISVPNPNGFARTAMAIFVTMVLLIVALTGILVETTWREPSSSIEVAPARSGERRPPLSGALRGTWLLALGLGSSLAPALATAQVRSRGAGYALPSAASDTTRASVRTATLHPQAEWQQALWSRAISPPGDFHLFPAISAYQTVVSSSARPAEASRPEPLRYRWLHVDDGTGRAHYIFRIDSGVFETETPGALLEVATHPRWLERRVSSDGTTAGRSASAEPGVLLQAARDIGSTAYADSLYQLFGQPRAVIGLIGRRGRAAGRLGEYIASRDSLATPPGHMTGVAQLRHALAHELGHRWQVKAKAQLAALWAGVPAIRDPKRYGYDDRSEHQAEAIAFAVNFLETTATTRPAVAASSLSLLDHYELLVPGTTTIARYLLLQPGYRRHPLRPFSPAADSPTL